MRITYEKFYEAVKILLPDYLGDWYEENDINYTSVTKVNRELDAISFVPKENENKEYVIAPTFYVNDFYETYLENGDFDATMYELSRCMRKSVKAPKIDFESYMDPEAAKSKTVFQIMNYEMNSELLNNRPHRRFLDLAVTYRIVSQTDEAGILSCMYTDDLMESLDLSEEELWDAALANTHAMFPPRFRSIDDMLREIRDDDFELPDTPDDKKMYVVSNEYTFCASNAMLYPEYMKFIADSLGSDIYILPASINEILVVKAVPSNKLENIKNMVKDINRSECSASDLLSDNVYFFSRNEMEVRIAGGS